MESKKKRKNLISEFYLKEKVKMNEWTSDIMITNPNLDLEIKNGDCILVMGNLNKFKECFPEVRKRKSLNTIVSFEEDIGSYFKNIFKIF